MFVYVGNGRKKVKDIEWKHCKSVSWAGDHFGTGHLMVVIPGADCMLASSPTFTDVILDVGITK